MDQARLDRLFEEALGRGPDERPAFVDAACGADPELRRELEALLRAHDAAGDFLDDPASWLAAGSAGDEGEGGADDAAAEWVGRMLSHYQILELIAAGGMGMVFKARDTRLDRPVTLKFVHAHLLPLPSVTERFVQEAKAASALDHPNLCTIYEIDETPDGRLFIAMAYYAGETLKARLARGPLPVAEALAIARAIANGLERAHEAGIVHRDVKPGNVMLTERGEVKILDFGIAKLEGAAEITASGARLGTVGYMSPEQVRGDEVDHRTDIWALGVVLAEMVTGRRPFAADNEAALVHAIAHREPDVPAELPPDLARVLRAALGKAPGDRFRTMAAFGAALDALSAGRAPAIPSRLPSGARRRGVIGAAAVLALAGVALVLVWRAGSRSPPPGLPEPRQLTFDGAVIEASVSRDGRFVAYFTENAPGQLLVQETDGTGSVPVFSAASPFACCPQWSPDGRSVAVRDGPRNSGRTVIVPRLGGAPRPVTAEVVAAWSPDGSRLVSWWPQARRLWITDVTTGDTTGSVPLDMPHQWVNGADWSPDGSRLVVATRDDYGLWTLTSDGKDLTRIVADTVVLQSPRWSVAGFVYYVRGSGGQALDLWRVPVTDAGTAAGAPSPVLVGLDLSIRHQSIPAVSLTGDGEAILLSRSALYSNVVVYPLSERRDEPLVGRQLTSGTAMRTYPRFSPDGRQVAFIESRNGRGNVVVVPVEGGASRQLTFLDAPAWALAWSPDGRQIAFASSRGGSPQVWLVDIDGGAARPIPGTHPSTRLAWAPAARIHYLSPGDHDFQSADPESGVARPLLGGNDYGWLYQPRPSPDGAWLAVGWMRPDNQSGLWLLSVHDAARRRVRDGFLPVGWRAAGDALYAMRQPLAPDGGVRELYVISLADREARLWATLRDEVAPTSVALTGDGRLLVAAVIERHSDAWRIDRFDPARR